MSRVFRASESRIKIVFPREAPQANPVDEAKAAASLTLQEADAEAKRIISEANHVLEKAKQEGFQAGYKDGYEKAVNSLEETVNDAEETLSRAKDAFKEMMKKAEPKILALSLEVAKKVAGDALAKSEDTAGYLIKEALSVMEDEKKFTLKVDPELVSLFERASEKVMEHYGQKDIEVVADRSQGPGVMVETPSGFLDATLDTAIKNIAFTLAELKMQKESAVYP